MDSSSSCKLEAVGSRMIFLLFVFLLLGVEVITPLPHGTKVPVNDAKAHYMMR